MSVRFKPVKIVSGGQTGADRAALDFALEHGFPHGGWCPQGRLAEDGTIDRCYRLKETPSPTYAQRTEWNVRDSDGTVIFTLTRELAGGSLLTAEFARRLSKPLLHLSRRDHATPPDQALRDFLRAHHIGVLNIAGPRSSFTPSIGAFVGEVLARTLLPGPLTTASAHSRPFESPA
jgi:hypothetical protein